MKEIPILYSTPMVLAKLNFTKTVTRRMLNPQPIVNKKGFLDYVIERKTRKSILWHNMTEGLFKQQASFLPCRYGQKGDWLYGRESWRKSYNAEASEAAGIGPIIGPYYEYRADHPDSKGWKPSIHMPKQAARIWDEVVSVRVERLQDITPGDAVDEGIEYDNIDIKAFEGGELVADFRNYMWRDDPEYEDYYFPTFGSCIDSYRTLWESINGPGSWEANPWVWRIETKPLSVTGYPRPLAQSDYQQIEF